MAQIEWRRICCPIDFSEPARAGLKVATDLSTHGRIDREHMLTGSVAEGVVRSATCPVLTVRPPPES